MKSPRSFDVTLVTWIGIAAWLVAAIAWAPDAGAAATGRVRGKIVATDSGEPLGFADVLLIPADTTLRRVGTFTNVDGTFLVVVSAGTYTIQIRAISYALKRVEGLVVEAGSLLPFSTALSPEALQQQEIVVEAKARQNTETSLLAARKKAAAVGDAVSAEQVRKSPDRDAAEVLRRVTGLTVSDGKYVFVRGLGERYSSTEVDGVRIVSPEQNKRVVPLDIIPAALLENIVVQKTYTADRPGEFGGGDVQVHTRDFPGGRTLGVGLQLGYDPGVTDSPFRTYRSSSSDLFGFGAASRGIPDMIYEVAGDRKLTLSNNPATGFDQATLAEVAGSFANVYSPTAGRAVPSGRYGLSYGDEFGVFGRRLGVVASGTLYRGFDDQDERQRFYESDYTVRYDYAVQRSTESVQLGTLGKVSYRLSPRHTLHVNGFWTHNADDEVMIYKGPDHNRTEPVTGDDLHHRVTRLTYLQRSVLSGSLEGQHQLQRLGGTAIDWKLSGSRARREQPDRRETTYDLHYYDDGTGNLVGSWGLGSRGLREYGDLEDRGWGATLGAARPFRLGGLGKGNLRFGLDHQDKRRENAYRRFAIGSLDVLGLEASPETLLTDPSVYVDETTLDQDNYHATQRVLAGYLSAEVPFGQRLRGTFGVRVEHGSQDVRSFDLFDRSRITAQGGFENSDWLPSANLTWSATSAMNLRIAASRTLSRPDLNELSPSPTLVYVGGYQRAGNPNLYRAQIDNYDARLEMFPALGEVFAAGVFYKMLHHPIEETLQGGTPPLLGPENSDRGHNAGVELEARAGLGRLWGHLDRLSVNANATFISSRARLTPKVTMLGTQEHPLQGQADYVLNGGLTYARPDGRMDATVMVSATGRRLRLVGYAPLPDVYEQPVATLDATVNLAAVAGSRVKVSAKNLLDPVIRELQGTHETVSFRRGRSFSIGVSHGL